MTTTAHRDYYEVLGVPRSADDKAIRAAYRRLARQSHPDVNPGDPNAEPRFKEINQAYEVLSDPKKRRLYDRFGHNWQQAQRMEQQGIPFDQAAQGRGGPSFDGSGFGDAGEVFGSGTLDDLLGGVFGREFGRGYGARSRASSRAEVQITLDEAFSGAKRVLETQAQEACPQCRGAAHMNGKPCAVCGGQGQVLRPTRIEVEIPPGVDTGSQVRISVRGVQVVLELTVLSDPRFRREGADLHAQTPVPLYTALLGGEIKAPTLKGQVSLTIPEGTQNGQVFRLSGQGMPVLGNQARRGNLFVAVQVTLPAKLSVEQKELLRQLQASRPA
ncbi:MAG: J domain-containing protein [Dehalococcoidia bacterium]|nr:J domain-containing protein [Dehalococcoidia bacterium]